MDLGVDLGGVAGCEIEAIQKERYRMTSRTLLKTVEDW